MGKVYYTIGVLLLLLVSCCTGIPITQNGAVSDDTSVDTCWLNSKAITATFLAANASDVDRTVEIPVNGTFCFFYVAVEDLYNITIQVDGVLLISNNITAWPKYSSHVLSAFYIYDSSVITFQGTGMFDGQGYDWWWYVIITTIDNRPHTLTMEKCSDIVLHGGLHFRNSPQYHILLMDVADVFIEDIDIYVNVSDQYDLLDKNGLITEEGLPIFPLNTDGIDPSGKNIFIQNVRIENFDDAVAVKPQNGLNFFSNCSTNVTVRDSYVRFGVGMTIGSVPPDPNTNCVRDVLFENIQFENPFKAIYIKTNPGWTGNGFIQNITYRNITATNSIWYPLWIGPQQEKQPGRAGQGCSFEFPAVFNCSTQPRVTVSDIYLEDVTFIDGHTLPGVIYCNATNPCKNINFTNVKNTGNWGLQNDYFCEYASGIADNCQPAPPCLTPSVKKFE